MLQSIYIGVLLAESVAKIVGLSNVKKRKYGKVEKNEFFFSFFSRTVFDFRERYFSFFSRIAVEISRMVFRIKFSRKELVFTHTF